jgi:hypothetical protein
MTEKFTNREAQRLGVGAEGVAEGRGPVDYEIIFGLKDGVAARAGITG